MTQMEYNATEKKWFARRSGEGAMLGYRLVGVTHAYKITKDEPREKGHGATDTIATSFKILETASP